MVNKFLQNIKFSSKQINCRSRLISKRCKIKAKFKTIKYKILPYKINHNSKKQNKISYLTKTKWKTQ